MSSENFLELKFSTIFQLFNEKILRVREFF